MNTDHYGRTSRIFGIVHAFGLTQRLQNLEKPSHLLVLRDCLLVQTMKSIVNCENLIEDRSLGRHEGVSYLKTATEPML